ncbi:MAG: 50S ribosomal protein L5 [Sulfolobales archaeon]|nr:50S ribosomal protein L5 [Sulfolobales archaeon]MCX8186391.1 50S ribosomal protein L5 [Sulfolobales archaeon]MDW7968874.1 50S ribosomal protein L5 [Sulfolobales archaeon]
MGGVEVKENYVKLWEENPMYKPRIAKVTVNIGVGEGGERLQRAAKILEMLTGQEPSLRKAKKTIKEFGVRKGEPIAVAVTLRGERALKFLNLVLEAVGWRIKRSSFDDFGNVSIGIKEHIVLPGVKYDPELGIFGMDVAITLERPGYRVMRRYRCRSDVPKRHRISREEAQTFFEKILNVKVM